MAASQPPGAQDPVATYISALSGSHWKTRWQAAQALGELEDSRAVPSLIQALDDSNQWVRIVAAEALGQVGDQEATSALLAALNDDSIWVRRASVVALGQLGSTQAVQPILQRVLGPPDNEWPEALRDAAADALGAIGGPAIKALIEALDDPDAWVSGSAAKALGRIGNTEAITPLTRLMQQDKKWVQSAATQALAQIADTRAVRAALSTDEAPRAFWKLMALREIDQSTINQLTALMDDSDQHIRTQAAEVLIQLGDAQRPDPLAFALRTRDQTILKREPPSTQGVAATPSQKRQTVRHPTMDVAQELPDGIGPLITALRDPVADVRLAAVEALGHIADARIVPALSKVLEDKDSRVRAAAARSLGAVTARSLRW
jgi:HEAT repeat protein